MAIVLFVLVLWVVAGGAHVVLRALGMSDAVAWAVGRTAGLVLVVWPAWWLASVGIGGWIGLGVFAVLAAAIVGGWRWWTDPPEWREILCLEAVFWLAAAFVLLIRLGHPEIQATEKPMDLGILSVLLRADSFPPPDMWLAGETLPYYYWGSLLWTVPLRLSGLSLDVGYNLIVAAIAGLAAILAWTLGRELAGGSRSAGAVAAFFALFAGTPDGLRQLLAGTTPQAIQMWPSSRQVPHAITEFPLFTLWLGDLHPHLLSLPLTLAAVLAALHAGREGVSVPRVGAIALLFGCTWAANPWAMPPTLAAVACMLAAGDGRWHWPWGDQWWRWAAILAVGVGGWLVCAPFHLSFDPPFDGVRWVAAWTAPGHLLLYAGCLLLPAFGAAALGFEQALRGRGASPAALTLAWAALTVILAAASGRITLVVLGSLLLGLVLMLCSREPDADRPALALVALGVFLLLVPELIAVVDGYGEQMHRMNTIFKSYFQAWVVLALALPVLLRRWWVDGRVRQACLLLLVVAALPHTIAALLDGLGAARPGLDGLRWMSAGDRAVVRALRRQPPGTTLLEAVGGAYTDFGRLSAASGVPAYLGWANHELVWRGGHIVAETGRRAEIAESIYTAGSPDTVRKLTAAEGIDVVAVGELERRSYPRTGIESIRAAGTVVVDEDGSMLIRMEQVTTP